MPRLVPTSAWTRLKAGSPGYSHYIFAVVFVVRVVVLVRLTSSPLFLPSGSDMQFYNDWAKQILSGHWTDHHAFYGLPLYPFLLALLYRVFGYSPFVPGLFQAAIDAGTAVLVYKIARRVVEPVPGSTARGSTFIGVLAAAGWCFFVAAQAYSAVLMPTTLAVFVFWLVVWEVIRTDSAPIACRCLFVGILIGITAMGVATVLFLVPFVLAALFLRRHRRPAGAAALLFAGILAGTAPCWLHNFVLARDGVFLSAHGGVNLWLGNNPEATGYPRFRGLRAGQSEMLRDSIDQAEAALGRRLKRSEVSAFWSGKAREYIGAHPGAWLRLLARKMANFWNAFEYDDVGIMTNLREQGVLFPGLRFGVVAVLGLAGAIFSWRVSPLSRWISGAIALELLAILPVFVTERYRLAAVPGLLILAAHGLQRLWSQVRDANYRNVGVHLGVVAAAVSFVTLPRPDPSLWALDAYNAGRFALATNNFTVAEAHLQRAHQLVPQNTETNFALGNLRLAQHDIVGAKNYYEVVLRIDPRHKSALNNLGVLALDHNEPRAAADYFQRALTVDRHNAKTHYLFAKALDLTGNRDQARIEAARAVELDPSQPEFNALQQQLNQK